MYGFIYVREHESYNKFNACKIGKTENIINRDKTYKTGEINKGKFSVVISAELKNINIIEKEIHNNFKNQNIYINGGVEFYDKSVIEKIVPLIKNLKIDYRILTEFVINKLSDSKQKNNKLLKKYFIENKTFENYYNLLECKNKIKEYDHIFINYLDLIETCKKFSNYDKNFPPYYLWEDFYQINLNLIFYQKPVIFL